MKSSPLLTSRRELLVAGTGAAALGLSSLAKAEAPASKVSIVRCRDYKDFSGAAVDGLQPDRRDRDACQGKDGCHQTEPDRQSEELPADARPALPHRWGNRRQNRSSACEGRGKARSPD